MEKKMLQVRSGVLGKVGQVYGLLFRRFFSYLFIPVLAYLVIFILSFLIGIAGQMIFGVSLSSAIGPALMAGSPISLSQIAIGAVSFIVIMLALASLMLIPSFAVAHQQFGHTQKGFWRAYQPLLRHFIRILAGYAIYFVAIGLVPLLLVAVAMKLDPLKIPLVIMAVLLFVVLAYRYFLVLPILAFEQENLRKVFSESQRLMRKRKWKAFLVTFLSLMLFGIMGSATKLLGGVLIVDGQNILGVTVICIGVLAQLLIGSAGAVVTYLFYREARDKEAQGV